MAIQGLRTTSNFATNQRPENWREGILMLYPNGKAPLLALTSQMKSRSVDDFTFNWWDKTLDARRLTLGASITAVAGTQNFTVTSGAKAFKAGDVFYVEESGEQVVVASDPGSDTIIQVTRGWASTTVAAVTYNGAGVNPNLLYIGSAFEQGSLAPTGIGFDPTQRYNYTQIFRDTLEVTRTAIKTRLRTGDQVKEAKRECLEYHGIGIERALWLGKLSSTTRNGKPLSTMNGLVNIIDSGNIKTVTTDYAGGLTMTGLEEYMYNMFLYGSSEKMAFSGNRAMLTIQQVLRKNASWQFVSGIKEYGMNVNRLVSPFGELVIKTHPLFNQVQGGTTGGSAYYGMESWMFVLDAAQLQYVYLKDSDTKYEPKLEANGMDGMKSGYLTECSIEVHHPKSHYLLKNMVAAAAG